MPDISISLCNKSDATARVPKHGHCTSCVRVKSKGLKVQMLHLGPDDALPDKFARVACNCSDLLSCDSVTFADV